MSAFGDPLPLLRRMREFILLNGVVVLLRGSYEYGERSLIRDAKAISAISSLQLPGVGSLLLVDLLAKSTVLYLLQLLRLVLLCWLLRRDVNTPIGALVASVTGIFSASADAHFASILHSGVETSRQEVRSS